MGLWKKEILIRPVSTVSVQGAIDFAERWLNGFYTSAENTDNSNYFADIFDPRGAKSRLIRVYHSNCAVAYNMEPDELVFTITGDEDDPGADDAHLLDPVATEQDFILADDPLYVAIRDEVDILKTLHAGDSAPENDTVEAISEASIRAIINDMMLESPTMPAGTDEAIVDLELRVAELEGLLAATLGSDPANI